MGYSGADYDPDAVDVFYASAEKQVQVCENGLGLTFNETLAKEILTESEITIEIDLRSGKYEAEAYGCDLTYDYVKINGDYRT
jgi:glutamate N-acetyltransferase/amino-acid N-acetyltransferase